jgi:hypothetical protein
MMRVLLVAGAGLALALSWSRPATAESAVPTVIMVASAYGSGSSPAYVPLFDVNRDGSINSGDMLIVATTFGPC